MDHLNAAQDHTGTDNRLKPEHRPHSPLDSTVILLDAIVEVGTLPDSDRLQLASRPILKPVCGVTGQDRFTISLTAVDHDPLGSAMPLKGLAQEPLGSSQIAPLAEPELDGVPDAIDSSIEIFPLASNFDVSLVNVPLGSDGSLP